MPSPGVRFLATILWGVARPLSVSLAIRLGLTYLDYGHLIPTKLNSSWHFTVFSFGILIFYRACSNAWSGYQEQREMRALGAIPVPTVHGRWPGSIDILRKMLYSFHNDHAVQFVQETALTHGNLFQVNILGQKKIVTLNPQDLKQMLATEFTAWEKGPRVRAVFSSLLGAGVFNSDGEMWKFHRNMTRPFFSRERIADFEIFRLHSDQVVTLIKQRCLLGAPIDLQDLAGRFTMDSASVFLFGLDVKSLSSPLPRPNEGGTVLDDQNLFVTSFMRALVSTASRMSAGPVWPLLEMREDATAPDVRYLHAYLDPIVDDALRKKNESKPVEEKKGGDEEETHETLLNHLAASTDDRNLIRDQLMNILLAGRDTTSHAITAVFYLISTSDKKVITRLREEILKVVGPNRSPTFDDIRSMKYLRAVINESLRLFPSISSNVRQSTRSTIWTGDDGTRYYIPKNSVAIWSTIGMQRRTDLWGPDALEFDPDRWLDERNKKYFLANPMIYIPFHAGPRMCLGQQFALNEASFFLIRILQAFEDIEFAADAFPPDTLPPPEWKNGISRKPIEKAQPKAHMTMYFKGGMWLRLKEAKVA